MPLTIAIIRDTFTNAPEIEALARARANGQGVTDEHIALALADLGRQHDGPVAEHVEERPSRFVPRRPLPAGTFGEAAA